LTVRIPVRCIIRGEWQKRSERRQELRSIAREEERLVAVVVAAIPVIIIVVTGVVRVSLSRGVPIPVGTHAVVLPAAAFILGSFILVDVVFVVVIVLAWPVDKANLLF